MPGGGRVCIRRVGRMLNRIALRAILVKLWWMAFLDKIFGVGGAMRDKVKATFGAPDLSSVHDNDAGDDAGDAAPLEAAGAYAALGLAEGATLADVREAYRAMARHHHPMAVRDGVDSEAHRALDHLLDALELLEEQLVPLAPASGGTSPRTSRPPATRKRATVRER